MAQAVLNGVLLAESDTYEEIEGNLYFPRECVEMQYLEESDTTTACPWKGIAHYYNVIVGDRRINDAAWYYPEPKQEAGRIKDHIAFWRGVQVRK